VLLLSSSVSNSESEACARLLDDPVGAHALFCTFVESPADRLRRSGIDPGAFETTTVVDVESVTRSAAADGVAGDGSTFADGEARYHVEPVDDPTDLRELGTTLGRFLAPVSGDGRPLLCFHSLTDVLQHTGVETAFYFLQVLTDQVDRAGRLAHYHLDADACDRETVATLEGLFDVVIDLRESDPSVQDAEG
jgi:hypothetical protein